MSLLGYPAIAMVALSNVFSYWVSHSSLYDSNLLKVVHFRLNQGGLVHKGHHSLPEEVNDVPRRVRRRLLGEAPVHHVGREAGGLPKRRKWLFLLGPLIGTKEDSHFPRVGVG